MAKCLKQWRDPAVEMAAARPLMKCCESKPSGGFKLESLSCCSTAVNTSPQKMSSFCQVKDGEDVLQIPTVGKWPVVERGGSLPSDDTCMFSLFSVSAERSRGVEVARNLSLISYIPGPDALQVVGRGCCCSCVEMPIVFARLFLHNLNAAVLFRLL